MATEYLKSSYKGTLRTVAGVNVAVFWGVIVSAADFSVVTAIVDSISVKDSVVGMIAPVAVFLLNGSLSADMKARIVYLRWRDPLPGSRAFSIHLAQESRADPHRLARRWGPFPTSPIDQNRLWYHIFKSVDTELEIHEAHRDSLQSRDLAGFGFLFLLLFGAGTTFGTAEWTTKCVYLAALVAQCAATIVAARSYGIRLVRTTLAIASQAA